MKFSKHLVLLTPGFAANEQDSTCTPYLQSYFLALQEAQPQIRLSVVAMHYPYKRGTYPWHGITVQSIGGANRRWTKPFTWRNTKLALTALHRQQPINAIHAYWLGEAAMVAQRFGRGIGVKTVVSLMGQDALPGNRYLKRIDLSKICLTAPSPFTADKFLATSGRPVDATLPFGLDPADADTSLNADRPVDILGVGSLIPIKRWDRFIRAVNQLRERHPHLRAVLLGNGPLRQKLQAQAQECGLGQHLEFVGECSRSEVLAYMSRSKVLLHTSDIEGTGLVMLEALARGCHLATTPVGIAAPDDKWATSPHTYGLMQAVGGWLDNPVDWNPRMPYTTAGMVSTLLPLYGI